MRQQLERDEQTIAIGAALGIFAVVLIMLGLVAWWLHSVSGVVDGHEGVITGAAVLVAGITACTHLVRSTRS